MVVHLNIDFSGNRCCTSQWPSLCDKYSPRTEQPHDCTCRYRQVTKSTRLVHDSSDILNQMAINPLWTEKSAWRRLVGKRHGNISISVSRGVNPFNQAAQYLPC